MSDTTIKLLLVEDQQLVREGLKGLLALHDDIRLIGEASDGAEALELLAREQPDVILSDMRMPRLEGISSLYKGFVPIVVRKVLWCSLFFVAYEKVRALKR